MFITLNPSKEKIKWNRFVSHLSSCDQYYHLNMFDLLWPTLTKIYCTSKMRQKSITFLHVHILPFQMTIVATSCFMISWAPYGILSFYNIFSDFDDIPPFIYAGKNLFSQINEPLKPRGIALQWTISQCTCKIPHRQNIRPVRGVISSLPLGIYDGNMLLGSNFQL